MWATVAGFISGCGIKVESHQFIDGKPIDQVKQEQRAKEKIKSPQEDMKDWVKLVREQALIDDMSTINHKDGFEMATITGKTFPIPNPDSKTPARVLLHFEVRMDQSYVKSGNKKLYALTYDPGSDRDGFAVANTYSLDDLKQTQGKRGVVELNQVIEKKDGVAIMFTSNPSFEASLQDMKNAKNISSLEVLNDSVRRSASEGFLVNDPKAFSAIFDKDSLIGDPTTRRYVYDTQKQSWKDQKGGITRTTRAHTNLAGGFSIENN